MEASPGGLILGCAKKRMSCRKDAFIDRAQFCDDLWLAEIEANQSSGQVAANLLRDLTSNEAVAELAINFVDNCEIGEQRRNITRIDIGSRRHRAAATLAEPIAIEIEMVRDRCLRQHPTMMANTD